MLHIARKCRRALIAALTVMALTITPLCALGDAEGAEYSYEYDDMSVRFLSGELMTTADGSPAIVLRYDFTNSRTKAESFVYAFAVTVYQGCKAGAGRSRYLSYDSGSGAYDRGVLPARLSRDSV